MSVSSSTCSSSFSSFSFRTHSFITSVSIQKTSGMSLVPLISSSLDPSARDNNHDNHLKCGWSKPVRETCAARLRTNRPSFPFAISIFFRRPPSPEFSCLATAGCLALCYSAHQHLEVLPLPKLFSAQMRTFSPSSYYQISVLTHSF